MIRTEIERQILLYVAAGYDNEAIARQMSLSIIQVIEELAMPGDVVLGTDYPKYSQAYSNAMQAVLIGQKEPQAALDEAQQTASGQ